MHWNAIVSKRWLGSSWLSVEKENIARKLFYLSQTGTFTTQCNFRGVSILPLTKNRLETPKPKQRTLAKTSYYVRFISEIGCFRLKILVHMSLEPYLSNSLYKSFLAMAFAIRSPMQWRPSNRKLAACLTGNEINKAYSNMNIDCRTREFVLFVIIRIWGSIVQIIAERPSPIVDIFKTNYG